MRPAQRESVPANLHEVLPMWPARHHGGSGTPCLSHARRSCAHARQNGAKVKHQSTSGGEPAWDPLLFLLFSERAPQWRTHSRMAADLGCASALSGWLALSVSEVAGHSRMTGSGSAPSRWHLCTHSFFIFKLCQHKLKIKYVWHRSVNIRFYLGYLKMCKHKSKIQS